MSTNHEREVKLTVLQQEAAAPASSTVMPDDDGDGLVPVTRREILKMAGAGFSLAALTSCTRTPEEKIVPYVRQPEELVPGRPLYYASTLLNRGYGTGVLVESHMGRPTKVEGNREHPASLGATSFIEQASVRSLYDAERSQTINEGGRISSWQAFVQRIDPFVKAQRALKGAGLRIVTGAVTSPTLGAQLRTLLAANPEARWYRHEPVGRETVQLGARLAYGRPVDTQYRFDRADVVVSLDSDFLISEPGAVRYARDYSSRRRYRAADAHAGKQESRLYAAEPVPSLTGARADHRLSLAPDAVGALARRLAAKLGLSVGNAGNPGGELEARWIAAAAKDLEAARGRSVVIAGETQPAYVHYLAHALNHALGNVGQTVFHTEPVEEQGALTTFADLVDEMNAGKVTLLILLGGVNPVYTAPADLDFASALSKVALRVHHGMFEDETSARCHWHVPESHELEAWSDARAFDGTLSIVQPMIAPLYTSKTAAELVATLNGFPGKSSYDLVREQWKEQSLVPRSLSNLGSFDLGWDHVLHDGVAVGSQFAAVSVNAPALDRLDEVAQAVPAVSAQPNRPARKPAPAGGEGTVDVLIRPDPTIWDGRYAANPWHQELPKPLSKMAWENAIWLGPQTARKLGVQNGDHVSLESDGRAVAGPVWVMKGQAEGTAVVYLGYGRQRAGSEASGLGYDAYRLRTSDGLYLQRGVAIRATGTSSELALTQEHHDMEHRELVRAASVATFAKNPGFPNELDPPPPESVTLMPPVDYSEGNQWGMSIDLSACTGCNACVVACQAENNIPTVGKEQVHNGREMYWIRIDDYFEGSDENPEIHHLPVTCMHCETAPCELVCPVGATMHSPTGLNEMVYNRCIGTRYCSHNCPYKVRRFNYLHWTKDYPEILKMQMNPDVTVRARGVMEKCTYCVQRINHARIDAKRADRPIKDGEIVTACEAVCPTQAIVFGDVNDPSTRVSQAKREPHTYGILTELNTRPRTTYLARLTNPNPELASAEEHGHERE